MVVESTGSSSAAVAVQVRVVPSTTPLLGVRSTVTM